MNKNTGFTLIEVLITMLIMAVGLLGLAGLQMMSLKNNQSTYNRSQATQLAYDMADRIRANMLEANNRLTSVYITKNPASALVQNECATISAACSITDMAEHDLFLWNQAVSTTLPSGIGLIEVNGNVFSITVNWDDNRDGTVDSDSNNTTPDDPNFKMSFQL